MDAEDRVARAQRRAAEAKVRELAAHERAEKLHARAAQFQHDIGRADLARRAEDRAEHAQELHEQARVEGGAENPASP